LVRPAILKMRGVTEYSHPVIEAVAEDSIPGTKPFPFVTWTYLNKIGKEYKVTLDNKINMLAEMATANSITIIAGGTKVKKGDKTKVWPLDWIEG
ncbi:MAG TPA: hypothetical protein VMB24_02305, partial [Dehalococcoidales bacterium]|nr:hypothetical protein [Dehalococcoidales bacterium]